MNHTASQSIKKLLMMSLVVFAGHAIGQTTQGTQVNGKQNAQQLLSPTKAGAGLDTEKKDAKPNLTASPKAATGATATKRADATKKATATKATAKPATAVANKPAKPVTQAPVNQLEQVKRKIADVEAKLKSKTLEATTKSALENKLVDLKKEQQRLLAEQDKK